MIELLLDSVPDDLSNDLATGSRISDKTCAARRAWSVTTNSAGASEQLVLEVRRLNPPRGPYAHAKDQDYWRFLVEALPACSVTRPSRTASSQTTLWLPESRRASRAAAAATRADTNRCSQRRISIPR